MGGIRSWKHVAWAVVAVWLLGCGGGGGSEGGGVSSAATIVGTVTKGRILAGRVEVYDADGNLLGRDDSLENGRYEISLGDYQGVAIVKAIVDRYEDEATGEAVDVDDLEMAAVARAERSSPVEVHLTPVVHLAYEIARGGRASVKGEAMLQAFEKAEKAIAAQLNLADRGALHELAPQVVEAGEGIVDDRPETRYGAVLLALST